MAAIGKLSTYPGNTRAQKALIVAKYSGKQIDMESGFEFGKTNKTPAFLAKFPFGKVPVLETADGDAIFESNAIAYYAANAELRGKNELEQSMILSWCFWSEAEVMPAAVGWLMPILGFGPYDEKVVTNSRMQLKKLLSAFDKYLLNRTFLVGERISLADITVACNLIWLYQHALDPTFRAPYMNVTRWFSTCVNQANFKAVLGEINFCETEATFEKATSAASAKKETKAPAAAPAGDGLGEDGIPTIPKPKDPFEKYPKGNFDFDDFKRFYSNNDEDKSVPYFWEKFDPENFSIWHCEYKYPEELTLVFMSCNLMSGMMQRLDKMRKNAFGSMLLFGEDHKSTISGIWVWRGHDLAFELSPDWQVDYESYDWKKLDPAAPETKKMVDEYFKWSGDFGGKKFNQGKIFK